MTEPSIEEIPRAPIIMPELVKVPIQVNVDTPSCKITVTTTGVQTRSQTAKAGLQQQVPPVEVEKPKERIQEWLDQVPEPLPRAVQDQPAPVAPTVTRRGREIKKPVIFDPADEDRRQKELRAEAAQKKSKTSAGSKKGSKEEAATAKEQQLERTSSGPKPGTSYKDTGAIPKSRARSGRR